MQKPKYRNRILYSQNAHRKRSGKKIDTNIEKFDKNEPRNGQNLTESLNRALLVMRFTIHTGLKTTPFEFHHGRKWRTELLNILKNGKTVLSKLSEMTIPAASTPKTPIYVGRDANGEITNHIIMAKTKT